MRFVRSLIATAALIGLVLAAPAEAAKGGYASVNGLKMYYEIQGTGRPLVLLHGGLCTIEGCLGKVRPPLAKIRRVPGLVEAFKTMKAEDIPKAFRDAYVKVAPDPKRWPTLVAKVMKQALEFKGWRPEDVKAIKAPTLIMIGDRDTSAPSTRWKCSDCTDTPNSLCFRARTTLLSCNGLTGLFR